MTPDGEPAGTAGDEREDGTEDEGLDGAALLERAVSVIAVLLVASTLGYVLWQASATTEVAEPTARVESVEPMDDGRLAVTVELGNRRGPGLESSRVAVRCGDTARAVEFEHVPADGRRTATVTCPRGTEPEAVVETWMEV